MDGKSRVRALASLCTILALALARPDSKKLIWRCEISASTDRLNWLNRLVLRCCFNKLPKFAIYDF